MELRFAQMKNGEFGEEIPYPEARQQRSCSERGLPSSAQGVAEEAPGLQKQQPEAELSQEGTSAGSLDPTEVALEQGGEDSSRSRFTEVAQKALGKTGLGAEAVVMETGDTVGPRVPCAHPTISVLSLHVVIIP